MRSSICRHVGIVGLLARVALDRPAILPLVLVPLVARRRRRVHRDQSRVDAGLHVACVIRGTASARRRETPGSADAGACPRSLRRSARSRPTSSTTSGAGRCRPCRRGIPPAPSMTVRWNVSGSAWNSAMSTLSRCSGRAHPSTPRARAPRRASATSCRSPARVAPKRSMMRSASSALPQPRSSTRDDASSGSRSSSRSTFAAEIGLQ